MYRKIKLKSVFMLELIIYAVAIGVMASVYKNILLYEPVLNWWAIIGQRFNAKWYYKPIWGCDKCLAGQLSLWLFLLNVLFWLKIPYLSNAISFIIPIITESKLNVLNAVILISISIFTANETTKQIKRR